MRHHVKNMIRPLLATLLFSVAVSLLAGAQSTGSLSGSVKDPSGAIVTKATVTLTPSQGNPPLVTTTNAQGAFDFRGIAAGTYSVSVNVPGFAPYASGIEIHTGPVQRLNISLEVGNVTEDVQVTADTAQVDVSSENNTSSTTINAKNLDAFSDDPDELQSQLLALAGPSVGPNGGQLYVDGFTVDAGSLPPKNSIREIRINQNPFSAEYDRLGYGRVEILTKPGSNKLHGRVNLSGNDLAFDTKDRFSQNLPGYYSFLGSAGLSGPLGKKGSFYLDYQHRNLLNDAVVSAIDPASGAAQTPLSLTIGAPDHLEVFAPRVDYGFGANNILTVSYQYNRGFQQNLGIGGFALPSQGYDFYSLQNTLRAKDTQIVGQKFVNDLSFQAQDQFYKDTAASSAATVIVPGAFTSGGDVNGYLNYHHYHTETNDTATLSLRKHTITFGGRLRTVSEPYISPLNFNGTYTFQNMAAFIAKTPSQFSITIGNPATTIFSEDLGVYVTDDWRARRNIMVSLGLRFETQNYIDDRADWAPRVGLAWGIGRKGNASPKTVIRTGLGIFYDRFGQQLQLQVLSLNGINQTEYLVTNPKFYPYVPTSAKDPVLIGAANVATTTYSVAPHVHAPYTIQTAVGLERQISKSITASVTYLHSRGNDQLISNNVNAPLLGTYDSATGVGTRPNPSLGNVYQYDSSAIFRQHQVITNLNIRASRTISLFGTYTLSDVKSDTSGASSFPSNPFNIAADYGRASFDIRHRVVAGGTIALKHGILLSPLLNARSGSPFNFTIGQDLIGSTIFNQRPAYATDPNAPNVVSTTYGLFNTVPGPNDKLVPVNAGHGPAAVVFNLRASKTITFGKGDAGGGASPGAGGGGIAAGGFRPGTANQASGGGSLGGRGLGGSAGGGSGGSATGRYSITFSAEARNLFNDVNRGTPIGDVGSRLFGTSNRLAGGVYSFSGTNRRIDLQIGFNF